VTDWRALTVETELAVLTLPNGNTITSRTITSVRLHRSPRRVRIGFGRASAETVYDDIDAVFEVATQAHRKHAPRG
jgi:hypothetical protein